MVMVRERNRECDGASEPEPEGRAQNAMQLYVHSQAVADKVSWVISGSIVFYLV